MKKVLIIDDNDDIRENVVETLKLAGYLSCSASNGKVGVEMALKEIPDLILCDIMMPELDGYAVLLMLSKQAATSTIPFIFLTAKAEHLDQRKGMDLGADDYIIKPFNGAELLNSIERRLSKKEAQETFYSSSFDQLGELVSKSDGLNELKEIIRNRKTRLLKKNQVVYYEGDPCPGLYLVLSGKIKTFKQTEEGRELITGFYSADKYLGINSSLCGSAYIDSAAAIESSALCLIPTSVLEELLNKYPQLGRSFIKLLSDDIREKEEQLLQLAYASVRKKMAEVILRLQRRLKISTLQVNISREDLAAMSGMATETVSRTLSDFIHEGIITKDGNIITIINLQRLALMKN